MFYYNRGKSQQKNSMSIEKSGGKEPPKNLVASNSTKLDMAGGNMVQQKFYLDLNYAPQGQGADASVAWQLNIVPQAGEKRRFLDIDGLKVCLVNYPDHSFPKWIGLSLDGYSGFLTRDLVPSNFIAYAQVQQVSVVPNQTGVTSYNVIYGLVQSPIWDISLLNTFVFRIFTSEDPNPIEFPTQQSILLSGKVVRVII